MENEPTQMTKSGLPIRLFCHETGDASQKRDAPQETTVRDSGHTGSVPIEFDKNGVF